MIILAMDAIEQFRKWIELMSNLDNDQKRILALIALFTVFFVGGFIWWLADRVLGVIEKVGTAPRRIQTFPVIAASQRGLAVAPEISIMRDQLANLFSIDELKSLAVDIGFDYDQFDQTNKQMFAQEFVMAAANSGRLPNVVKRAKALRPHVVWPRVGPKV